MHGEVVTQSLATGSLVQMPLASKIQQGTALLCVFCVLCVFKRKLGETRLSCYHALQILLQVPGCPFPELKACHRPPRIPLCVCVCVFVTADEMSESRQTHVTLHDIDPQALEQLVQYAYTAEIVVGEGNVQVRHAKGVWN